MTHDEFSARVYGGDGPQPITAADVATEISGRLVGDPSVVVRGIAPLDRAGSHELSFLSHARYVGWFAETRAGVVVMSEALSESPGAPGARIIVDKPMDAMVSLLGRFHRKEPRPEGIHGAAMVAPTASIGRDVTIEAGAVVQEHAEIGDGCWIGPNAVVGVGCKLGRDVRMFAGAVLYAFVDVGDRVQLHAGSRVGREGFGFVPTATGPQRIPHAGRCVIEHDVEVGANSCIDRGSVDDTIVGAGTKIDNLVHIAHNVRIGRMCFIVAQVGIAGSTRIEDGVQLGGQVGVGGHLTVGARASIAAQGGVFGDVPAGETWSGYPARPHKEALRAQAALFKLSRIIRPLEQLLTREPKS